MIHFFSRRAYNPSTHTFSNNPATLTRYFRNQPTAGGAGHDSRVDLASWIAEVLDSAETPDILIYVHGFNTSHREMLDRHRIIADRMAASGYRGAVVSFDWPSNGSVFAYPADRANAKTVAPFLVADGIFALRQAAPGHRLHILAHSMGAYLVVRGFSEHGGNWRVGEVLFVAADVERRFMANGAWAALVMARHCKRLTNYYNIHDEVLDLPKLLLMGGERAGRVGLTPPIPANHQDLYCAAQYEANVADKSHFNSHRWYFADDGFYRDVALTVAGTAAAAMPTRRPTDKGGLALLT